MTELVDPTILDEYLAEAKVYSKKFSRKLDSSMTADINGFSWGYCDALVNNGTNNLFTCIHGHHGIYPLFKTQVPFWWKGPSGEKLLVWNGEIYHFGNETYIMPNGQSTYLIEDSFSGDLQTDQFIIAKSRIYNYFADLENSGYKYSFAPMMISGFISDNAGPNILLLDAIKKWNQVYGEEITIKLIGLNDFFEILRNEDLSDIPTYSGDWNDWWADGVGSTPAATKIYKNAIRNYRLLNELGNKDILNTPLAKSAKDNLMLYAEHTWGYSSSVSEPWNTLVNELEYRKLAYSVNGSSEIGKLQIKEYVEKFGYAMPAANRSQNYKIVNPYEKPVLHDVNVYVEDWEHFDGVRMEPHLSVYLEVYNLETNEVYPSQTRKTARGYEISFVPKLKAKETILVGIRLSENSQKKTQYLPFIKGADGVQDIVFEGKDNDYVIETEYLSILLSNTKGVEDIIYKPKNRSIVDKESLYPVFSGIYERTDIVTNPVQERRRMGRNRKGRHAKRFKSVIKNIEVINRGAVYDSVVVDWELEGTKMFSYILKVYKHLAKVECTVRIQKTNEWAPENLYLSLPFSLNSERYLKKSGSLIRPAIDQIPGTNTDFYLLDTGILYRDNDGTGLIICPKDTPLVTLGDLENHPIELFTEEMKNKNSAPLYSWIMNNYWETNFKVDLSGFYEFTYSILVKDAIPSINDLDKFLDIENQGLIALPIN